MNPMASDQKSDQVALCKKFVKEHLVARNFISTVSVAKKAKEPTMCGLSFLTHSLDTY
jgi:hypothetical protein